MQQAAVQRAARWYPAQVAVRFTEVVTPPAFVPLVATCKLMGSATSSLAAKDWDGKCCGAALLVLPHKAPAAGAAQES